MSEILPVITAPVNISNDQRHDAALTIVEHCQEKPETIAFYLAIIGLVEKGEDGALRSVGSDEFETPWFTPAYRH